MEILQPPRIDSLESQSIRVLVHTALDKTETIEIPNVYMFQTVFILKQHIMLALNRKVWSPEYTFLAVADGDTKYKPLEFAWEFAPTMDDPYAALGQVKEELYKDDEIQPIIPTVYHRLLLRNALGDERTVHVWSAAHMYEAIGRNPNDSVFYGFFRYFFPLLDTKDDLTKVMTGDDSWFAQATAAASTYFTMVNERFAKLNEKIQDLPRTPFQLRTLSKLRYELPKKDVYAHGLLEQHFYEMKPTAQTPFIRFFPSATSLSPLVKMAAGTLQKKELFESYMADESPVDDSEEKKVIYSVILIKSQPIQGTDNVCWTICIYENGTADLTIGASRRDRPLLYKNMEDAFAILPTFLKDTVWDARPTIAVSELSAQYLVTVQSEGVKPTQQELQSRYDVIVPLFRKEEFVRNAWVLRYKAVDNYSVDMNPVIEYITFLYLTMNKTMESVDFDELKTNVSKEFGISQEDTEKFVDTWRQRYSEEVITERDELVKKYNSGTLVTFYNDYPDYKFNCVDIQSFDDLQQILTVLSVFVYNTADDFGLTKLSPAQAKALTQQEQAAPTKMTEEELLFSQMMGLDIEPAPEANEQAAEAVAAAEEAPIIRKIGNEFIPNLDWEATLLNKLQSSDQELFKYKDSQFGTTCQSSSNRQPNVMSTKAYKKARDWYGDDVFWVEAPLEDNDLTAMKIAYTTVKERVKTKTDKQTPYPFKDIIAYEKRALQLGFYLKGIEEKESVLFIEQNRKEIDAYVRENPDAIEEMRALIIAQKSKPLWTVIRAGTNDKIPNYYICSEYWCLFDQIPLIPSEFKGTQYRVQGKLVDGKPADTCPFCEGKLVKKKKEKSKYVYYDDAGGATVIQRLPAQNSSKINLYVGYIDLTHPDKFAQPCCFIDYDSLRMAKGSRKAPPPAVELPSLQRGVPADELETAASVEMTMVEDENSYRPFSPVNLRGSAKNDWYICKQIVLGRRSLENKDLHDRWFTMTRGLIAVPPREVNELLGQDPDMFLTKNKGARSKSATTKLNMPGHAFIRYGLGTMPQNQGENALSFLAFVNYAINYMMTEDDSLMIPTNNDIASMFETKEPLMYNAFIQANYGTLLHEFSLPGQTVPAVEDMKFQRWREAKSMTDESQRAFAAQAYLAWNNFKNYILDEKIPKDLRLLETLFTCQGLFSMTGFVLVKIKLTKEGPARFECPKFGISQYSQKEKPPAIFILENELTGLYDPLVFYEGQLGGTDGKEEIRALFGAIQPNSPQFNKLSEPVRGTLRAFYDKFYSGVDGCSRTAPPVHPWIEIVETKDPLVPRLSELVALLKTTLTDYSEIKKLVRDRSNRLVGVIVKQKPYDSSPDFYIPCVDDGQVLMRIPSVYGEESLPLPTMEKLIAFLVGKQSKLSPNRIAYHFPGLKPKSILSKEDSYVGLKLECQAIVPFKSLSLSQDVKHAIPDKSKATRVEDIAEFPWELDIVLLGPANPDTESVDFTDEEALEEAYEHIRISFSNWLQTHEGKHAKKQIELLRQARRRLPLYELQKRLDVLIHPYIQQSVTRTGSASPSILRRDCLQIKKKGDCVGSCTFSDGRCLIHAKGTQRYVDPVRVLTVRLTDELLRTFRQAEEILQHRVSLLRPHSLPKGTVVHEGDTVLFSATGRGTKLLYEQLGYTESDKSKYVAGLIYPEEIDVGIAADGAYKDKTLQFAADIERDVYGRLTTVWPDIVGIDDPLPDGFRGTDADWAQVAKRYHFDIIKTRMGPDNIPVVDKVIKSDYTGAGESRYIMLDVEGVPTPLLTQPRVVYKVKESQLPAALVL